MTFWLGRPGNLIALPTPVRGRQMVWSRQAAVQSTLGGGRVVQFAPGGRRAYGLAWRKEAADVISSLEVFATGGAGPGPYTLIDPERRNMLSVNQSTAGSATGDGSGLSVVDGSGETAGAQSTIPGFGPHTYTWTLPDPVTSGRLLFDPPAAWLVGFPIPAGEPWTFQAWVRGAGADPILEVAAVLRWLDTAGLAMAENVGTPTTVTDGAWTLLSVSRSSPPPGAACVAPELRMTTGSASAPASGLGATRTFGNQRWATWRALRTWPAVGASGDLRTAANDWVFGSDIALLVDRPQLDMWPSVRPWLLGTGMPQVSWLDLPDIYDLTNQHDLTATLVEVG